MRIYERPVAFLALSALILLPLTWLALLYIVGPITALHLTIMYAILLPAPLFYVAHGLRTQAENSVFYAHCVSAVRATPRILWRELCLLPGRLLRAAIWLVLAIAHLALAAGIFTRRVLWPALVSIVRLLTNLTWTALRVSATWLWHVARPAAWQLTVFLARHTWSLCHRATTWVHTTGWPTAVKIWQAVLFHTWRITVKIYCVWLPTMYMATISTINLLGRLRIRLEPLPGNTDHL